MENKRPTLADPAEFALIKKIYFMPDPTFDNEVDPLERLDRQEHGTTKNQAR